MCIMSGVVDMHTVYNVYKVHTVALFALIFLQQCNTQAHNNFHDGMGLTIVGVSGSSVKLPCLAVRRIAEDPILVVWFQGNLTDPVYSLDRRGGGTGTHWTGDEANSRYKFNLILGAERVGILAINPLRPRDEGQYRCRVDYQETPSVSSNIHLTTIVPPDKHRLMMSDGSLVKTHISVPLASDLNLTCDHNGGKPVGEAHWLWNRKLVLRNQGSKLVSTSEGNVTHLNIHTLSRSDNGSTVECVVKILGRIVSTISSIINVILPPIGVKIAEKPVDTINGRMYLFRCESTGSSPSSEYTWALVDQNQHTRTQIESESRNGTLYLMIKKVHDGLSLVCSAYNPLLKKEVKEDSLTINVLYEPEVHLKFGHGISSTDIREGEDVYLECDHLASPPVHTLQFYRNGLELGEDRARGRLISSNTLVIQNVSREDAGQYRCMASNTVGTKQSDILWLTVKYGPVCVQPNPEILGMSIGETKVISCPISANPPNITLHWFFNKTDQYKEYLNLPGVSGYHVRYSVRNIDDYGTLQCFGENSVGYQKSPCLFHIKPSSAPGEMMNCTAEDPEPKQITLHCSPGDDGGLDQVFYGELYKIDTGGGNGTTEHLVRNTSTSKPVFHFHNLEPGSRFKAVLYASNIKGRSQLIQMTPSTVKETFRLPLLTHDEGSEGLTVEDSSSSKNHDRLDDKQIEETFNKMFLYLGIIVSCTSVCACVNLVCGWKIYTWKRLERERASRRTSQNSSEADGWPRPGQSGSTTSDLAPVWPERKAGQHITVGPSGHHGPKSHQTSGPSGHQTGPNGHQSIPTSHHGGHNVPNSTNSQQKGPSTSWHNGEDPGSWQRSHQDHTQVQHNHHQQQQGDTGQGSTWRQDPDAWRTSSMSRYVQNTDPTLQQQQCRKHSSILNLNLKYQGGTTSQQHTGVVNPVGGSTCSLEMAGNLTMAGNNLEMAGIPPPSQEYSPSSQGFPPQTLGFPPPGPWRTTQEQASTQFKGKD